MKKLITLILALTLISSVGFAKPRKTSKKKTQKTTSTLYFRNCKEAKKRGYYNIRRGEPGYRPQLDRDKDGIACEL